MPWPMAAQALSKLGRTGHRLRPRVPPLPSSCLLSPSPGPALSVHHRSTRRIAWRPAASSGKADTIGRVEQRISAHSWTSGSTRGAHCALPHVIVEASPSNHTDPRGFGRRVNVRSGGPAGESNLGRSKVTTGVPRTRGRPHSGGAMRQAPASGGRPCQPGCAPAEPRFPLVPGPGLWYWCGIDARSRASGAG